MCVLANIYRNVKMNYELAEIYYGKASALGYASAMNNLAVIYEYDKNDYEQAEVYYKKAAELGNMIGLWNLGRFYDKEEKITLWPNFTCTNLFNLPKLINRHVGLMLLSPFLIYIVQH